MKETIIKIANFLIVPGGIIVFLACMINLIQDFFGLVFLSNDQTGKIIFAYVIIILTARLENKKNSILD